MLIRIALGMLAASSSLTGCTGSSTAPVGRSSSSVALGRVLPLYDGAGRAERDAASTVTASPSQPASAPVNEAPAVSLPQVIDASVRNDPRIRAAFAEVLLARAELLRESAFDNPELTIGQTLNPYPNHRFNVTRQGGPPQLDVGINYSLERVLFGQRRAAVRAADREVDAQLAAYANVARQRVLDAITAYVDVLQAMELSRLSRDEVAQLERLEGITARRVALGSVGQVELNRVHIAVIAGRRRELTARLEQDNSLTRLRMRMGPEFMTRIVRVADSLEIVPRDPPDFATLLGRALKLRPDLAEQERRITALQAAEQRERRRALPSVSVGVGYTRQFQEHAIGQPDANAWGATLSTSVPVFDRNQGGIAGARADLFEAAAVLSALKLEMYGELDQALRSLHAAGQILQIYDPDAMRAADSVRETVEEAYGLGGRTLLELLDAQQVYREAYREHVIARAEYMRAMHRLNTIVGEEVMR